MIDDRLRMTTTSRGVYSGQIALVSLQLPSLSPPFSRSVFGEKWSTWLDLWFLDG